MALLKNIRKKTRNLNITINKKQQQKLQQFHNDENEIKSKEDELIIKTIVILKHVISLYYWILQMFVPYLQWRRLDWLRRGDMHYVLIHILKIVQL